MLKNWVYTGFSTGYLIAYSGVMAKDCGAVSVIQDPLGRASSVRALRWWPLCSSSAASAWWSFASSACWWFTNTQQKQEDPSQASVLTGGTPGICYQEVPNFLWDHHCTTWNIIHPEWLAPMFCLRPAMAVCEWKIAMGSLNSNSFIFSSWTLRKWPLYAVLCIYVIEVCEVHTHRHSSNI